MALLYLYIYIGFTVVYVIYCVILFLLLHWVFLSLLFFKPFELAVLFWLPYLSGPLLLNFCVFERLWSFDVDFLLLLSLTRWCWTLLPWACWIRAIWEEVPLFFPSWLEHLLLKARAAVPPVAPFVIVAVVLRKFSKLRLLFMDYSFLISDMILYCLYFSSVDITLAVLY